MKNKLILLFCIQLLCSLSDAAAQIVPINIECHAAYRTLADITSVFEEKIISVSSEETRTKPFSLKSASFKKLTISARYFEERLERGLKIEVKKSDSSLPIAETLYQFSESENPLNQFDGHGFTGLNYVKDHELRAELQYWCIVKK